MFFKISSNNEINMKSSNFKIILVNIGFFQCLLLFGQDFNILNQITIGGTGIDYPTKIIQSNSDFFVTGYTYSPISGNKTSVDYGFADYWLIKMDNNMNITWQKSFGGSEDELFPEILIDADGFLWLSGTSSSPISGNKTVAPKGNGDIWVIKCDTDGNIIWQNVFGSDGGENGRDIIQLQDGNILVSGTTSGSSNGDVSGVNNGNTDVWLIKLDSAGTLLWESNYGGTDYDSFAKCTQLNNGNIAVASSSYSNTSGDKTEDSHGDSDMWIFVIDLAGNVLWDLSLGGNDTDNLMDIISSNDAIYLISQSFSQISGDKTEEIPGSTYNTDAWIVKLDYNGNILWDRSLGGEQYEIPRSMNISQNGSIEIACGSWSGITGDKTEVSNGLYDFWFLSLDPVNGVIEWQKTIGGQDEDELASFVRLANNHYVLAGHSRSNISGDKSDNNYGAEDFWIVEMTTTVSVVENTSSFKVYPNPTSNILYIENKNTVINEIRILDLSGKTIKRMPLQNYTVNLETLDCGVYLMEINSDQGSETVKIIKK